MVAVRRGASQCAQNRPLGGRGSGGGANFPWLFLTGNDQKSMIWFHDPAPPPPNHGRGALRCVAVHRGTYLGGGEGGGGLAWDSWTSAAYILLYIVIEEN